MAPLQLRVILSVFGVLLCVALLNTHFFQTRAKVRDVARLSKPLLSGDKIQLQTGSKNNDRSIGHVRHAGRSGRRVFDVSPKERIEAVVAPVIVRNPDKGAKIPLIKILAKPSGQTSHRKERTQPRRETRSKARSVTRPKPRNTGLQVSKLVQAVQRELTSRGYEPGPVDGVEGLMTKAAIMAFQVDKGINVSGLSSEALLRRLVLGGSVNSGFETNSSRDVENRRQTIKTVQLMLKKHGYHPGTPNGLMNVKTRIAIKEFEKYSGLVPSGRVSGRLIGKLSHRSRVRLGSRR